MPLQTSDARMLQLIDILKQRGIIRFTSDFAKVLNMSRGNIVNIKDGRQSFTAAHIFKVCELYGVSADWIGGFSEEVFRKKVKKESSALLLFQ